MFSKEMKRVKFTSKSFWIILPIFYLTITINSYCQFNGYIITKEAMSKTFLEILVGVGVSFDISGKYPLFIEARIEEMLANDPPTPFISNFGLVAGVGF